MIERGDFLFYVLHAAGNISVIIALITAYIVVFNERAFEVFLGTACGEYRYFQERPIPYLH